METEVRFGVVGITGYARTHIERLRRLEAEKQGMKLWGVVAKYPEEDPQLVDELKREGVAIFNDVDSMLSQGTDTFDVVTLPTSIPTHAPLSIQAMRAGYHVFCEKPPAVTVQAVDRMIQTAEETNRMCAIGFQAMYSPSVQRLKSLIATGRLGAVQQASCRAAWPRASSYYLRNQWAGRFKVGTEYVLDGPMTNALAHYLQLMLFLTGETLDASAVPHTVQAELYRARPEIEGDDTSCLRVRTQGGVDIHFNVTHAADERVDPAIQIETSEANILWEPRGVATITRRDGDPIQLDNEGQEQRSEMFRNVARVVRGEVERPLAPVDVTRAFVATINGAHESAGQIRSIPEGHVEAQQINGGTLWVVRDIIALGERAFRERSLFSELGVPWAMSTRAFSVEGYTAFNL